MLIGVPAALLGSAYLGSVFCCKRAAQVGSAHLGPCFIGDGMAQRVLIALQGSAQFGSVLWCKEVAHLGGTYCGAVLGCKGAASQGGAYCGAALCCKGTAHLSGANLGSCFTTNRPRIASLPAACNVKQRSPLFPHLSNPADLCFIEVFGVALKNDHPKIGILTSVSALAEWSICRFPDVA